VLVVVASSYDAQAKSIVARWGTSGAALLSAEDLCSPGWAVSVPHSRGDRAVIGGKVVKPGDISGILTLRPAVFAPELRGIHVDDRPYVAAELNALLTQWLMAQRCPILNRPSLSCLAGPGWRRGQWIHAAARLGIPVRTLHTRVPQRAQAEQQEPTVDVLSVGTRCFWTEDRQLISWHLRLAQAARTGLLSTRFSASNGEMLSAHSWPLLNDPEVLDAIRGQLESDDDSDLGSAGR
jgi:hypothetical protein